MHTETHGGCHAGLTIVHAVSNGQRALLRLLAPRKRGGVVSSGEDRKHGALLPCL